MRIALHFPDDHPVHPGAVGAYRLGRIEDGVHNHSIATGETIPIEALVAKLVADAKREFPDAEVRVERLIDNGDETGSWISAEDYDPEEHVLVGAGQQLSRELSTTSESAGKGK